MRNSVATTQWLESIFMKNFAFKIAILYAVIGLTWIYTSDLLVAFQALQDPNLLSYFQHIKGFAYVIITSVLLFFMVYRYENYLRNTQTAYQAIFDYNPNPMWMYDLQTHQILAANAEAIAQYGYSSSKLTQLKIQELCIPSELDRITQYLQQPTQTNFNTRHQTAKGKHLYVNIYSQTLWHRGKLIGLMVAIDVTRKHQQMQEIHQLNEQLTQNEHYLRSLLDFQTTFLVRLDNDGCYTFANNQFLQRMRHTQADLNSQFFEEGLLPEDIEKFREAFRLAQSSMGKPVMATLRRSHALSPTRIHWTTWEFIALPKGAEGLQEVQAVGVDATKQYLYLQKLEHYKTRLEHLLDNVGEAVWACQANDFQFVFISQASEHIFGYSPDQLYRNHRLWLENVHPDDRSYLTERLAQLQKPHQEIDIEYRFLHSSGDYRYIQDKVSYAKDPISGQGMYSGLATDITELRRTQTRLAHILDSITDGFFTVRSGGVISYVNQAFERILGLSRSEMLGGIMADVLPQEIHQLYTAYIQNQTTAAATAEVFMELKNMWLRFTIYPIDEGVAVYFQDISNERNSRRELLFVKNNLEAIVNSTSDLIWSVDTQQRLLSANQAYACLCERLTGKTPVVGESIWLHLPNKLLQERWEAYFEQVLLSKKRLELSEFLLHPLGQIQHIDITFNPLYDDEGRSIGLSCFMRDTTAEKHQERQVRLQYDRLSEIAWIQSHEMRRYVANVLGLAHLLSVDELPEPEILNKLQEQLGLIDEIIHKVVRKAEELEL